MASLMSFTTLKVWQKCALIAVPFLVPVAVLLYLVIGQNTADVRLAQSEVHGLEYLRPVKQLTIQLGHHRGLGYRAALGDKSVEAEKAKVAGQIDETVRDLNAVDAKYGAEFKTNETKRWESAKSAWDSLKNASLPPADLMQKYDDVIQTVLALGSDVREYSAIALDPSADAHYLQSVAIARGIPALETLGKLRSLSAGAAVRGKKPADEKTIFTNDEQLQVNTLLGQVEGTKNAIDQEVRNAMRANANLKTKLEPALQEYQAKVEPFVEKVRGLLDGSKSGTTANELFAAGSEAVNGLSRLYDTHDPLLSELLAARTASHQNMNYFAIGASLISLLVVCLLAVLVTRSLTRQIDGMNSTLREIEEGNYQSRAPVLSQDELGQMATALNKTLDKTLILVQSQDEKAEIQRSIMKLLDEVSGVADGDLSKEAEVSADVTGAIADSFNFMIAQLRKIIGNVQSATLQVSTAANRIYASAEDLAEGSENQTEQIVNTSAAIEEIAQSIQQVSENAVTSTAVAQQALQTAKQGNVAVRNTIEGMNKIREQAQETAKRIKRLGETSQEIGQIVQLIDDIADRTSILALNASIQAAAAGEAGRGFAVVAEEVERLAVRSTEATKKISTLVNAIQGETNEAVNAMEKSIQEVVSGSKVANQAGQSLNEIEGVSMKLAELIQSISLAAKQQARGSEALTRAMGSISQITQQTATGTKLTAESVNSLAKLADELRSSVSTFKLPTGYGHKA